MKNVFYLKTSVLTIAALLILSLSACSGGGSSSPPPAPQINQAPAAIVDDDFSSAENTFVTLDGSSSNDSDGIISSFSWTQVSGTPDVTLNNADSSIASFTAPDVDSNTILNFELTVTDNNGAIATDSVAVTITPVQTVNQPPIAIAPNDFSAIENTQVSLDGSASSDSDGSITSYSWVQTAGSPTITITDSSLAIAVFTAPEIANDTLLTFELTVTDNSGATNTDSVDITIQDSAAVVINSIDTKLTTVPFPGTRAAVARFEFAGPQNVAFECSIDSSNFAACSSPHQLTVTDGYHDFEVRSVNNGQTDPTPAKWRWEYISQLNLAGPYSPFEASGLPVSTASDLGAFTTSCEAIAALTVRNDQSFDREELTWTGVAIPRELNLTNADNLILIGEAERQVAVQFRPLARWDASPNDTTAPLKWLEVAAVATVGSFDSTYSLRHCTTPPNTADTNQLLLASNSDGTFTINSGIGSFVLDPTSNFLMSSATIGLNQFTPRSITRILNSTGSVPISPLVDQGSFVIEQDGPVKIVVSMKGHFFGQSTYGPGCDVQPGFITRMTFTRSSGDIDVEHLITNECGDGLNPNGPGSAQDGSDWWNRTLSIERHLLYYNLANIDQSTAMVHSNTGSTTNLTSTALANNSFLLESVSQPKGNILGLGTDWRNAQRIGSLVLAQEFFELPMVAASDSNFTAMIQIPWMRFREPLQIQTDITSNGNGGFNASISAELVDDTGGVTVLGEAQGIWNFFRLSFAGTQLDSNAMFTKAQQNQAAMERGLLWHTPIWNLNQAKVFPELPEINVPEMSSWIDLMEGAHDNTVSTSILGSAQRDRMKGYSLIGWPDNMMEGIKDVVNTTLDEYVPGGNVWSPTNSELLMWFATGEPKWAWDYALPAEWTFWHTNTYNTGSRGVVGSRSGLVVASVGSGEGARYRSGFGTDDKFYNQGSEKAYVIRPHQSLADRFQAAGDTYVSRYVDNVANREEFVSLRSLSRQTVQHLNALQLATKYSTTNNSSLRAKFDSVMQEYIDDNLSNGIFCGDDDATVNTNQCVFAFSGVFHYVALWQEVFLSYAMDLDPSDPNRAVVINAIAQTARLIDNGIPRDTNDAVTDLSPTSWGNSYQCDFSSGTDILQQCQQFNCTDLKNPQNGTCSVNPFYDNAHLNTLATAMLGHRLNPTLVPQARCEQIKAAFNSNLNGTTVGNHLKDNGFGWHKDSSQLTQVVLYGIAAAQHCN